MPSPNPQPKPQPIRSSTPPGAPTAKKHSRVSAATIKPRSTVAPKPDFKPVKRPGSFRLLIGFIATLAGAWLLTLEDYQVGNFVKRFGPGIAAVINGGGDITAFNQPDEAATESVAHFMSTTAQVLPYSSLAAGLVLVLFAGICLKRRLGIFLVTIVVLVTGSIAALEALSITPHLSWIVIGAAGVAYLIQSGRERVDAPPVGMLGYLLIFVSLMTITRQWCNWPLITAWVSDRWANMPTADVNGFFNRWGELVTWCVVLALATLGASFSKGRLLHTLGAAMLVILVTLLLRDARYELVHFPQLGAAVKPIASHAIGNVQNWQWLVLVELSILAAVLVYRGLGAGGFTIAMAALWLVAGFKVDSLTGRMLLGSVSGSVNLTGGSAAPVPTGDIIAAVAAAVWIYLNAIFAGIIAVCGLRMMIKEATTRWWVGNGLWLVFAMLAMWVYMHWPQYDQFNLLSQLQVLVYYEVHLIVIPMIAVLAAAIFGIWALRWNSRYESWLYAAATTTFLGTLASFATLATMIHYSFLEPLPIVSYIALAVCQSALMWVLLIHVNFRDRRADHRQQAAPTRPGAMPSLA